MKLAGIHAVDSVVLMALLKPGESELLIMDAVRSRRSLGGGAAALIRIRPFFGAFEMLEPQ